MATLMSGVRPDGSELQVAATPAVEVYFAEWDFGCLFGYPWEWHKPQRRSFQPKQLHRLNLLVSNTSVLNAGFPSLSPDGKFLVYRQLALGASLGLRFLSITNDTV